jgi:hypothetical protein
MSQGAGRANGVSDGNGAAPEGPLVLETTPEGTSRLALTETSNGEAVATCVPPPGNIGQCSMTCQESVIPREKFLCNGQVNTLEIELVNLLSVDAGNGTFGWTSILYSVCVEPG